MLTQFLSIGFIMLLSAMLPGPDFAIVTKNTLLHSRRAGFFTTFGIVSAVAIHLSYCSLGLAIIISKSLWLFNAIKYTGAMYLIYLGSKSLLARKNTNEDQDKSVLQKIDMSGWVAFRQGFLCNLLNPKAALFFLSLFTVILKPNTSLLLRFAFAFEMLCVALLWFCGLSLLLSHAAVLRIFSKLEKYIEKILGMFLIGFGLLLVFVTNA